MKEFDKSMIEILGRDAFHSTDFKVTDNCRVLAKAVNYMFSQLNICKNMMDDDHKNYIDEVRNAVVDILKGVRQ